MRCSPFATSQPALGVKLITVYRLVDRSELHHVRESNEVRVVPADLDALIARNCR